MPPVGHLEITERTTRCKWSVNTASSPPGLGELRSA
jgi:hypothetical protein